MDKKNKERIKLTTIEETKYTKALQKNYGSVYSDMRAEIIRFVSLYGADGKMNNTMHQYGRYDKLIEGLLGNLSNIKASNPQEVSSYLKDQYMLNYYYTGFTLETNYQAKLAFKPLSRRSFDPLSITGKISLQQNKDIVRSNVAKAIQQSIAQGEGVGSTSQRIKKVLEGNMNDALRIAQTETTTAANDANFQGMQKAQHKLKIQKKWIATLDSRTRDRHKDMDGEVRDIDKKFSNGLMYPGDQSAGKPGQVISCRCSMTELVEGYENSAAYRRARGLDGKNEVIPYKTYREWEHNRL